MEIGQQNGLMSRLGNWFRRENGAIDEHPRKEQPGKDQPGRDLPAKVEEGEGEAQAVGGGGGGLEPRNNLLRPWARRDQAIESLQRGIGALSELLGSIRDNMDRQSQRHDELMTHLSGLPEALKSVPEAHRVQGEALQAIHQTMERQASQQSRLGEVLDRLSAADSKQARTLDSLHQTVAALGGHDEVISRNLQALDLTLTSVGESSHASARMVDQLKESTTRRDGEFERLMKRQNTRLTAMLSVAVVVSLAALATVSVVGYFAYQALTAAK